MALKGSGEDKRALLLVAFGTSHGDALQAFGKVPELCREAFPGLEIRLAYASFLVRRVLKARGQEADSPVTGLARLSEEGYRRVAVQPLLVVPGVVYEYVVGICRVFSKMRDIRGRPAFAKLSVGRPLLERPSDCREVARALQEVFSSIVSEEGIALVLVGHGSEHPGGMAYSMLHDVLQEELGENVLVGTLEGSPGFEDILAELKRQGIQRVVLVPFMLVSGGHVLHDLAGDREDSWQVRLRKRGFSVSTLLRGLGEYDAFAGLFVERARGVVAELCNS